MGQVLAQKEGCIVDGGVARKGAAGTTHDRVADADAVAVMQLRYAEAQGELRRPHRRLQVGEARVTGEAREQTRVVPVVVVSRLESAKKVVFRFGDVISVD